MKLPFHEHAYIRQEKITRYLLDLTHEEGQSKARFFIHFGFSMAQWGQLQDALLAHARTGQVTSVLDTARGRHYAVEGEIDTPSGRRAQLRTVWVLETGSEAPRFITAYPLKKGQNHDS